MGWTERWVKASKSSLPITLLASITCAHIITTQRILNKFIELNFSVGCIIWPWCCLFQDSTTSKNIDEIKEVQSWPSLCHMFETRILMTYMVSSARRSGVIPLRSPPPTLDRDRGTRGAGWGGGAHPFPPDSSISVKGMFLSESTDIFVINPNRQTFSFPETENLNFGDF